MEFSSAIAFQVAMSKSYFKGLVASTLRLWTNLDDSRNRVVLGIKMKGISSLLIVMLFTASTPFAFSQTSSTPAVERPAQSVNAPLEFGLQDGMPVRLRTNRNLSSADAKTGETVDFEVLEDIKVGDIIVIPRGSTAIGTVTRAKPKGRLGKAGKLDIAIDSVRTIAGEKLALRAVKEMKGKTSTTAMTGAIVASSILFFPAAPFFLFLKGKDIKIPKGTEISAYINGDSSLDRARYVQEPDRAISTSDAREASLPVVATVLIKSEPDGADIFIDGKFVGSTPSTLQIPSGDHSISIRKVGFSAWERTISAIAGGNIRLSATLEKP